MTKKYINIKFTEDATQSEIEKLLSEYEYVQICPDDKDLSRVYCLKVSSEKLSNALQYWSTHTNLRRENRCERK